MKKDKKLTNNIVIGIVYYVILVLFNVAEMVYYHFYVKSFHVELLEKTNEISFVFGLSLAYKIAPIVCIFLSVLSILIMLIRSKQHALGLLLPMFFLSIEIIINSFLFKKYYDSYDKLSLIVLFFALVSIIIVFIAQTINNLPLRIIGSIMIILLVVYTLYCMIYTLSANIKADIVEHYDADDYFFYIYSVLYIVAYILVIVQMFLKKAHAKQTKFVSNTFVGNGTNMKQKGGADKLLKYKELLDIGAITQEEFDKKKKELLDL